MTSAIEIRNVSKIFKIYDRPVDLMWETLLGRVRHRNFEALKDINLSIEKGSVVGLIGRNGAGKSTLLRIIAQTLQQSSGDVRVGGRISAILELGTGFNPDYTGRENIYLGGLCLGLTRQEISDREAEIIAFSELSDFIDQPFKTYSSGMQARLTFSVAVSVDPDILIVDEALSVGDAKFQLKSFDRMKAFRREGKTILVVSHDINSLAAICDRAVLLERGSVLEDGDPNEIGKIYHELLFAPEDRDRADVVAAKDVEWNVEPEPTSGAEVPMGLKAELELERGIEIDTGPTASILSSEFEVPASREHRYGGGRASIVEICILDELGVAVTQLKSGAPYRFRYIVEAYESIDDYVLGVLIRTPRGIEVMGTDTRYWDTGEFPPILKAGSRYVFDIKFINNFANGIFFLTAAMADGEGKKFDVRFDCLTFEVVGPEKFFTSSLVTSRMSFHCESIEGSKDGHATAN